jgi:hypothetical protein
MQLLIVVLVLVLLVTFVTVPLRREQRTRGRAAAERAMKAAQAVEDLEAAREAKYREIRDAELDHSTGKLSERDFRSLDQALRAEAIEILRALDRARELALEAGASSPAATGAGEGQDGSSSSDSAAGDDAVAGDQPVVGEQLGSGAGAPGERLPSAGR